MNLDFSSAHSKVKSLAEIVERACRHWEVRRQAAMHARDPSRGPSQAFTITLSREAGTLGTAVAEEVGKRLGWHVYDHELLEKIAQELSVRATLLESLDERQQSWLTESIESFVATPNKSEWGAFVSESAFVRHLVETILALGIHGECVIVGRGAAFILPAETTLRVRLVAPAKDRVSTLGEILHLPAKEAARRVRTIDQERLKFVRNFFHKDATDARHYDLVLNAAQLTVAAEATLIIDALCHLKACGAGQAIEREQHCS